MAVKVRFFGRLRTLTGIDQAEVEVSALSVAQAIESLARNYDRRIKEELVDEAGNIDSAYALFIGGERVVGLDTPVKDGDELAITSLIAGGDGC